MAWAVGETASLAELTQALKSGTMFVADDHSLTVAFLIAEPLDASFYVHEIAVASSHQRRGIGALLIEAALAEARQRGFATATLTTDRTLAWNAPYYARLGFRILSADETPPQLAARLASQPSPERRCAMIRAL